MTLAFIFPAYLNLVWGPLTLTDSFIVRSPFPPEIDSGDNYSFWGRAAVHPSFVSSLLSRSNLEEEENDGDDDDGGDDPDRRELL